MGMIAYIYKNGTDCSNNGISSKYDQVVITNVPGPFEPSDEYPAVKLVKGYRNTVKIVPEGVNESSVMFGGSYISTSDSRFSRAVENIIGADFYGAVAFHDRIE